MMYSDLKKAILEMPPSPVPMQIKVREKPMHESVFLKCHFEILDNAPSKTTNCIKEKQYRLKVVKPFYDRLYAYYLLKQLE